MATSLDGGLHEETMTKEDKAALNERISNLIEPRETLPAASVGNISSPKRCWFIGRMPIEPYWEWHPRDWCGEDAANCELADQLPNFAMHHVVLEGVAINEWWCGVGGVLPTFRHPERRVSVCLCFEAWRKENGDGK